MTVTSDYSSKPQFIINLVVVSIIAILFSSFTLWLIDSWIKYPFFVLEIFVIIVIYLVLRNYNHSIHLNFTFSNTVVQSFNKYLKRLKKDLWAGIILIIFSSVLLISNSLDVVDSNVIQLVLAFVCISFLSGYCLLKIFDLFRYFSKLESIILSFIASFVFSGFSSLFLIYVEEQTRSGILSCIFIVIGIIFIIKELRRQEKAISNDDDDDDTSARPSSFLNKIDILAIILCISFYCFFFYLTYPNATLLPGVDTARHFRYTDILSTTPELYTVFIYILFHSYGAALDVLSGTDQKIANIQTIHVILSLFLPVSIYVLAKRFLASIDKRIPALATIFYTFFSNLSFIYFSQLKVLESSYTGLNLIVEASQKSINGLVNFLQPFFYFTPQSVAIIMLIIAFMLLRVNNIPRIKIVAIFTILILSMYLVHVSEAVVFMTFIIIYSFLAKRNTLNLNNALIGSLFGSLLINLFTLYSIFIWPDQLRDTNLTASNNATLILYGMPILLGAALLWRLKLLPILSAKLTFLTDFLNQPVNYFSKNKRFFILTLAGILTFIYLFGLIIWVVTDDFRYSLVAESGFIPWFIYPVMFGVTGLLAILSLRYLPNLLTNTRSAIVLVLFIITTVFLIGRLISFMNVNMMTTGYWEIRLMLIVFIFLSLIAPIPLIKLIDSVSRRKKLLTTAFISIVVSSVVLFGFSSLMLQSELWVGRVDPHNITEKEWEAIDYLKNILEKDTHAYTIAPSPYSNHLLNFAPAYKFYKPDLITLSKYPDIPLLSLSAYHLDHAYLYLHSRDMAVLNDNPQSWLAGHLLPTLPIVYSNDEVTIYNVTAVSYPVSNSNTTLVNPTDSLNNDQGWSWYVNDILSQSQLGSTNYTEMLDLDPHIFKSKNLILSFDPPLSSLSRSFYDDFTQVNTNVNVKDNNYIKWNDIFGVWNYTLKGLHGGLDPNDNTTTSQSSANNMILSPFTPRNLSNITTTFKVNDVNSSIANYASIVHSFQDPKNYQQASIHIYKNNVYVLFSKVINGTLFHEPRWPGLKTDLKLNPDDTLFDMSLSIEGSNQILTLNGIKYSYPYNNDDEITKNGQVGLSYGRIKSIDFYNFRSEDNEKLNLREFRDYIQYAQSGGNLFVFNTNGYGAIANSVFNISSSPSVSNSISISNDKPIQQNNDEFSKIDTTTGNIIQNLPDVKGFLNWDVKKIKFDKSHLNSNSSILIMEKHIGQGMITYVDVYPLLSKSFEYDIAPIDLSYFLNNISKILPLEKLDSEPTNFKDLSAFRAMSGNGTVKINTTSVIFPDDIPELWIKQKEGDDNDNHISKFVNVTKLDISNYTSAMINANDSQIILNDGRGLYSKVSINGENTSSDILFLGNASIQGISNNKIFKVYNVSSINVKEHYQQQQQQQQQPFTIYVKQPQVNVEGDILLKNQYYFVTSSTAPSPMPDPDRLINGSLSMNVFMSDYDTLIDDISLAGSVQRVPPVSQYDELNFINLLFNFSK